MIFKCQISKFLWDYFFHFLIKINILNFICVSQYLFSIMMLPCCSNVCLRFPWKSSSCNVWFCSATNCEKLVFFWLVIIKHESLYTQMILHYMAVVNMCAVSFLVLVVDARLFLKCAFFPRQTRLAVVNMCAFPIFVFLLFPQPNTVGPGQQMVSFLSLVFTVVFCLGFAAVFYRVFAAVYLPWFQPGPLVYWPNKCFTNASHNTWLFELFNFVFLVF